METRELTLQRLKKFVTQRFFSVHDYKNGEPARLYAHSCSSSTLPQQHPLNSFPKQPVPPAAHCPPMLINPTPPSCADPRRFMAGLEALFFADYSLAIKAGVHFTLCGGTICRLGTKKHHDTYLDRLDTLDLTGSFGMTELGECGQPASLIRM